MGSYFGQLISLALITLPLQVAANDTATYPSSDTNGNTAQQALIVLGDSISAGYGIRAEQGWVELLDNSLQENEQEWYVVNASISGDTTGGGLARLPALLETHEPGMVIIELGGNDGLRGYPVNKIETNLHKMVELVKAQGATPVIAAMRIPPNYGPRYTRAFDGVFAKVAQQQQVTLIPFLLEQVALAEGMMQSDGIHPTAEAQPLLLQAVWPVIEPLL